MQPWHEEACEQIDSGFFSSDSFHDSKTIEDIKWYIQRWLREIESIEQMLKEKKIQLHSRDNHENSK